MKKALLVFTLSLVCGLASAQMMITEIMYNPPESGTDSLEFIEFTNASLTSVNLTGWTFTQGVTHTFGNITVPAGGIIVVCVDSIAMQTVFGIAAYQWDAGGLGNGGEDIVLQNSLGTTIDSVDYDDASPWPTEPDGNGQSLVFCNPLLDNNSGANWQISTDSTGVIINALEVIASPGSIDPACSLTPPPAPSIPTYPIATINTVDGSGVADSVGVTCFTTGVVVGIDMDGNAGLSFTIMDTLGGQVNGINIFNFNDVDAYVVTEGDSILVRGTIGQFNGLTQFGPDSISLLNAGNMLPDTATVLMPVETTESELIRVASVYVADATQWPSVGSSANVDLVTPANDTITMRIDSDTDVDDLMTSAPAGFFDIYGIGGQFDSSNPFTEGYQILPRYVSDIDTSIAQPNDPIFNIIGSNQTVDEAAAGTYNVVYSLTNPNSMAVSVNVIYDTTGSTAINGTDVTFASPISFMLAPNTSDTDTVTITIIDDLLAESSETARIVLSNPVNGILGTSPAIIFTIEDDDTVIPEYPISIINNDDANGEPDSIGVYCWTRGVVLGVDLDGNAGLSFTIWDQEGINIFNFNDISNYTVTEGDSIRVRGEIDFFNGLTELFVDSITVLSTGNTLPTPMMVDAPSQMTESEPIMIQNVMVIDTADWPSAGGSTSNVDLLTCNGDTITMRIDTDTDVDETYTSAPTGMFTVRGIGGQFDNSTPYLDGYQIFPMTGADIILNPTPTTPPSLLINEIMAENTATVSDANGDFDDWVELYNTGANPADVAGLYFSNDLNDLTKFQVSMSSTETVSANGYALVWCDNEMAQGDLHTNFELDLNSGFFAITHIAGCDVTIIDSVTYDSLAADESFGRLTDGGTPWVTFGIATPLAANEILSVEEAASASNELKAWPNPATEVLTFNRKVSFVMYNLTGQVVVTERNTNFTDVSNLQDGLYIIQTSEGEMIRVVVE